MALKPGTTSDTGYAESMAQAMEDALRHYWQAEMGAQPLPVQEPFLRLMFVAVAQGVVRHLVERPDSFQVTVDAHSEGAEASGYVKSIGADNVEPSPATSV